MSCEQLEKLHNGMTKRNQKEADASKNLLTYSRRKMSNHLSTYLRNHTFILNIDSFVPLRIFIKTEKITNTQISELFDCLPFHPSNGAIDTNNDNDHTTNIMIPIRPAVL